MKMGWRGDSTPARRMPGQPGGYIRTKYPFGHIKGLQRAYTRPWWVAAATAARRELTPSLL